MDDNRSTSSESNSDDPRQQRNYEQAAQALSDVMQELSQCTEAEQKALQQEADHLQRMMEKLDHGQIDIVVFGEIDTGKSAMINALIGEARTEVSVRGGWTKEVWSNDWEASGYTLPGMNGTSVRLVDTPGINEVQGETRARMARQAAEHADLILFVTDSDLNDVEHGAIVELAKSNKPVLVILNKIDLYSEEQLAELRDTLRERLKEHVGDQDLIETAADPRPMMYVIESADGSTREELRKPKPMIEDLRTRILEVLQQEGKALLALNAALFAADTSDRIASTKVRLRDETAQRVIWTFAASKAVAMAVNPIPVVDVVGGSAVDVSMVVTLARVYQIPLSRHNATQLIQSIVQAAGWVTLSEIGTHVLAGVFKGLTAGMSTAITAPFQAAAAGYGSYIVGHAAKYYLEHGASWGGRSPKSVVREIVSETDRASVINHIKQQIHEKLTRNAHADKAD